MRRAVVITGLVRDEAGFGAYLDGIAQLERSDLRIVLSTWKGEMARYPAIAARLSRMGADVIEQVQPNLKLPGHMLHQVVALERGLSCLDDDVPVLKTRPDICGVMDVVEFLDLVPESATTGPFGHHLHVVGMFGAHPLYINDIIYAGMAADLRRLCALSFLPGVKYPRLAPEQWLWSSVLAAGNPVLDAYLSVNPGLLFNDATGNAALRGLLTKAPLFARAIAAMATLVHGSLAYLHPDPHQYATRRACEGHTLDALLWDRLEMPALDHHPTAQVNTWLSQGVIDAVRGGTYASSPLGDAVRGAFLDEPTAPLLAAEASALRAETNLQESPPPWELAETGASYAASLETEVNTLRREIDRMLRHQ